MRFLLFQYHPPATDDLVVNAHALYGIRYSKPGSCFWLSSVENGHLSLKGDRKCCMFGSSRDDEESHAIRRSAVLPYAVIHERYPALIATIT